MIKITLMGDCMCEAEHIAAYGDNFRGAFAGLADFLAKSDYVTANLEAPIAGPNFHPSVKWSFNAPAAFAQALKDVGVDLVSTTNNHSLDRGVTGLKNTLVALDEIGLAHVGTNDNPRGKIPFIKSFGNFKVGLLANSYGTNAFANHLYLAREEKYLIDLLQEQERSNVWDRLKDRGCGKLYEHVYNWYDRIFRRKRRRLPIYEQGESDFFRKLAIAREIRQLREAGADYIISLTHVGGQHNSEPTAYTYKTTRWLLAQGVDACICSHEHVIHSCEYRGDKLVAYCLGNLTDTAGVLREPYDKYSQYSILVNLYLNSHPSSKKLKKVTFTITKSVPAPKGGVKTALLYDLINRSTGTKKKQMLKDNAVIVKTVLGKLPASFHPVLEYEIS